jgi:SAM-dependent methyltransferase
MLRTEDRPMTEVIKHACRSCRFFDRPSTTCQAADYGSALRRCLIGLLKTEFEGLPSGLTVLEIGCGAWPMVRDLVGKRKSTWIGLEPAVQTIDGQGTIATLQGNVDRMNVADESVDYVVANQSAEHWYQYGSSFASGIAEVWRVLRPGGVVSLNFPLYYHGHPVFFEGKVSHVPACFPDEWWSNVKMEIWRDDSRPLAPVYHSRRTPRRHAACIGVIRATKKETSHAPRCRPWRLNLSYLRGGHLALCSPLPLWKAALTRAVRGAFLHRAPKGPHEEC